YLLLAAAHRGLGEFKEEREALQNHLALDADAIEPRIRLAQLAMEQKDWLSVREAAEQILAINPLIPAPHRLLVQSAEALSEPSAAIEAHQTLLMLDPLDKAEHHYQLARLLSDQGKLPEARRQVVMSLEDAPRYRAAYKLLLEIVGKMGETPTAPATPDAPAGEERKP